MKLALLFLAFSSAAWAATFNSDGSRADVEAKIALASNGDTVTLPAGTFSYTQSVLVDKGITVQGAGIGQTFITDNVPDAVWSGIIFILSPPAGQYSRLTGIEFQNGSEGNQSFLGAIYVAGNNTDGARTRIDNCRFNGLQNLANITCNGALGVADHNDSVLVGNTYFCYVFHANWDNGGQYGDGSWADSVTWNSDEFWYMEDNTITNSGSAYFAVDSYRGGRWVFRYNTTTNVGTEAHGTDSGGRHRGTRAVALYNNNMTNPGFSAFSLLGLRSGTARVYNNTATGFGSGSAVNGVVDRALAIFYFGMATGDNAWDTNDGGNPFLSGTTTSATVPNSSTGTVTDSTKTWTVNQWAGYTVKNNATGRGSMIVSNTATILTFMGDAGFTGSGLSFNTGGGESYEINLVTEAIDQPGKGAGDLLVGDNPTPANPNQVDDPVYVWDNSYNGGAGDFGTAFSMVKSGEHYFNSAPVGYTAFTYPYPWPPGSGSTLTVAGTTTVTGTLTLPP